MGFLRNPRQVLQTNLKIFRFGKKIGLADAQGLISHGPEGIEPHGLVARCKGDDVGILPGWIGDIIIQDIK